MALLAAFNFDEASGNFLDASGNGRDWALNNNAARAASGHTNGGLTKAGTGMPVIAATPYGQTTARTFMFWMKGAGTAVWWFRFYAATPDTGAWGLYLLSGLLTMRLRKGGANTNTSVAWTDDGNWHHYACTYDGTNGRLYKDAVLVATSASVTAPLDTATAIDCMESGNNTQTMDDLRIYDDVKTQAEISTLMSTPVTSGGGGSSGTITGTLPGPTAALVGTATASGTLAGTVTTPTAALAGTAVGSGLLAASLPMPSAALVGTARAAAALAGTLPEPVADIDGAATASGAVDAELPELAGGLTGTVRGLAVLAGELPVPVGAFTGTSETEQNLLLGILPELTGALAATAYSDGAVAGTLPMPMAQFTGQATLGAMLTNGLPELEGQFFGVVFDPGEGGQLNGVLPMMVAITGRTSQVRERDQQRRATRNFIMASPMDIILIPNAEVRTASGAVEMAKGVARPVQTFRLIPMSHTERPVASFGTGEGASGDVQRKYDLTLLAEWSAVMEKNDYWIDEAGVRYVIEAIIPLNGYERKGLVMAYGAVASIV